MATRGIQPFYGTLSLPSLPLLELMARAGRETKALVSKLMTYARGGLAAKVR